MADLSTGLYLRLSPADLKRWRREAEARGVKLSDMVRQSVEWRLSPEGERDARAVLSAAARRVG